jgi:hypothetical protein
MQALYSDTAIASTPRPYLDHVSSPALKHSETHRSQVMRKMQAESFAELVRMAVKLRIRYRRKPQPGLERQSETSMFVVRNGSRSLVQVAAQQKKE